MIDQVLGDKLIQLSEAHVLNVQRELQTLEAERLKLNKQIEQLSEYLTQAVDAVTIARDNNVTTGTTPDPQTLQ